jgi:hypothetical protein
MAQCVTPNGRRLRFQHPRSRWDVFPVGMAQLLIDIAHMRSEQMAGIRATPFLVLNSLSRQLQCFLERVLETLSTLSTPSACPAERAFGLYI